MCATLLALVRDRDGCLAQSLHHRGRQPGNGALAIGKRRDRRCAPWRIEFEPGRRRGEAAVLRERGQRDTHTSTAQQASARRGAQTCQTACVLLCVRDAWRRRLEAEEPCNGPT